MNKKYIMKVSTPINLLMISVACLLPACYPQLSEEPTPVTVLRYSETTAFDLLYPVDWISSLMSEGLLVFGPPNVISLEGLGPSVTIYRIPPEMVAFTLEGQLEQFLERGPYAQDFIPVSEMLDTKLGQYPALRVDFAREAIEFFEAMTGFIVSARMESGAVYHFVATTPTEQWSETWPLMTSVIQSVNFNE